VINFFLIVYSAFEASIGKPSSISSKRIGHEEFVAHLVISDAKCIFRDGPHEKPGVVIKSPAVVWRAIFKGEPDGQIA